MEHRPLYAHTPKKARKKCCFPRETALLLVCVQKRGCYMLVECIICIALGLLVGERLAKELKKVA